MSFKFSRANPPRVGVVGATGLVGGTEFSAVRFKGDDAAAAKPYEGAEPLTPEDIADAVHWVATRPPRVNVNTLQVMPVGQSFAPLRVHRRSGSG